MLMSDVMLNPLMLRIERALHSFAQSRHLHLSEDYPLRQVEFGLVKFRLQQKSVESLLPLEAKSCYHLS